MTLFNCLLQGIMAFRLRQPREYQTMNISLPQVCRYHVDARGAAHHQRTLPGFPIIWSIICFGAGGMFMWQCATLVERYYSYRKKVNVEIIQQPVQFPWVSVCNNDHLDILNVARIKAIWFNEAQMWMLMKIF